MNAFLRTSAVPILLGIVAVIWLVIELWGGPTIYHGGDELGPLSRWPDRYRAAWTRPVEVQPAIDTVDGDIRLPDVGSELRINRAADDVDPSLSPGGDRLLFASNRPGGPGGFDLYISARGGSGYGEPTVLDPPLSTLFQERSPSLALLPDGSAELLFSSNRLHGLATDFDLYLARRTPDGRWQDPTFLDTLSSVADERFATLHPEGDVIVFSRPEARGYEYYESFRRADGNWSEPIRLRGLRHPDNGPEVRFDEGGSALLFARSDDMMRSRLRILRALPEGGVPWGAWILLALALLLLLVRAMASRWKGLEVLYRCLLISVLVHLFMWWLLEDRGLEPPTPSEPGPPAEEVAPIELDPELFARANAPAASERAHGEEVSVERAVTSATEVARLQAEREALALAQPEPELAERTERALVRAVPRPPMAEAAPDPSRDSSAIDATEFALRADPGREDAADEQSIAVDAAAIAAAERPETPASASERAELALAAPESATPELDETADDAALSRAERAREAELAEAPSREAPTTGSPLELAESPERVEPTPAERAAPLARNEGTPRENPAEQTPRPTRIRPGPGPDPRPASELARIEGTRTDDPVGGSTPPTRADTGTSPTVPTRATRAEERSLADGTLARPTIDERAIAVATPRAGDPARSETRPSPSRARSAAALEAPSAMVPQVAQAETLEPDASSTGRSRSEKNAATPATRGAVAARRGQGAPDPGLRDVAGSEAAERAASAPSEMSLSDVAPAAAVERRTEIVRASRNPRSSTPPSTEDHASVPKLPERASAESPDRTERPPARGTTAMVPERSTRRATESESSGAPIVSAAPLREGRVDELALSPLPAAGEPAARPTRGETSSTVPSPPTETAPPASSDIASLRTPEPTEPGIPRRMTRSSSRGSPTAVPPRTTRSVSEADGATAARAGAAPLREGRVDELALAPLPAAEQTSDRGKRAADSPTPASLRGSDRPPSVSGDLAVMRLPESGSPGSPARTTRTDAHGAVSVVPSRASRTAVEVERIAPPRPHAAPLRESPIGELALAPLPAAERASGPTKRTAASSRDFAAAPPTSLIPRIDADAAPPGPTTRGAPTDDTEEWIPWVSARRGPRKEEALRVGGGDESTEAAVEGGLAYLASRLRPHGGWANPRERDEKYGETAIGRSALALLAFLGAGHAPGTETEYSELTERAIGYLLSTQRDRTGHFGRYTTSYSHAIATYALGEAVLMGAGEEVREAVADGVAQIIRYQELDPENDDTFGGWGYYYHDGHRYDGYPRVSVTVWQLMALETAKLAGIEVPDARVEIGKNWVLGQWSDRLERYLYNLDPRRLASEYPTLPASTPAAAFILQVLGHDPEDRRIEKALGMVAARPPSGWEKSTAKGFIERGTGNAYFWYYGTLALFIRSGEHPEEWQSWNESLKETLLPSQDENGSWEPISIYADYAGDTDDDRIYTTAVNVLTLEVYYRYLTPFQKQLIEQR